ncbi:uncharacterized protein LOC108100191 [Drosophila ficusphila]|uniref:uncharacterized protein LOC108100191 n=1 Tax=Drosophila ficusphila TaxID=30025 RepID=UPI001C896411|nr:uncharacterized protein LOC108100191 [Drosophila ficusphila]
MQSKREKLLLICYLLIVCLSYSTCKHTKYFVDSAYCKMPFVDPFSRDVMSTFRTQKLKVCHHDKDLITPEFDPITKRYRLHIHKEYVNGTKGNITLNCSYQKISRSSKVLTPDNSYRLSYRRALPHHLLLPKDVEFLTTSCSTKDNGGNSTVFQQDGFALVQDKFTPKQLKENRRIMNSKDVPKPSVVIMGLDSTSRMNLRRSMPKVSKYVDQEGWFEMQGYNKVGDNTLPNLLAVLTGDASTGPRNGCSLRDRGCLDKFNFIWKRYKEEGYTTAYAEDCELYSTFNYIIPGFVHQPVDYYLRPFLYAAEDSMKLTSYLTNAYCVGRHLSFRYVWDFGQQFIQRFLKEAPLFGFLWSNSFTHDSMSGASALDNLFNEYLDNFQTLGLFNRSVVIFMSDHGDRFNNLRNSPSGFLEERLPMMFIHVPPWFKEKYPQYVENLKKNRNRLSSNYDLHMTLHHLLQLNNSSMSDFNSSLQAAKCKNCQSLFFELPVNRTCAEAGIDEKWCTCHPPEKVNDPKLNQEIGQTIVDTINQHFREKNVTDTCHELRLGHIRHAYRKMILATADKPSDPDEHIYTMEFWTLPKGLFEATVKWNKRTQVLTMNVDELSRLNTYEKDSWCVKEAHLKKYCICYEALTTTTHSLNFRSSS